MADKTYVIGHASPDLDSVAAAIAYADYKNKTENTDSYVPAIAGQPNKETAYVLERFELEAPQYLESAAGKSLVLVDHNEFSQAVNGIEEATIAEVLDHHKVNFSYGDPIPFLVRPWGSSSSIIADLYFRQELDLPQGLAGLMLAAALVDTVISKSPTCTEKDTQIMDKLADRAGISDWRQFGMDLFKIRSSVQELGAEEIIKGDFKDFDFKQGKLGIGQVETVDLQEFADRDKELLQALESIRSQGGYHSVILFITDIIKEGSQFLVASEDTGKLTQAFGSDFANNQAYLEGVISRKKQVAPKLAEVFDK